jgi:hypothetical protein
MIIHEREHDRGEGKWDIATTRYVSLQGGSRSRLPVIDDPDYHRYPGFVGVDERLSETLYTIPALFTYLGGRPVVGSGQESGLTKLIQDETLARLQKEKEEEEEKAKKGG